MVTTYNNIQEPPQPPLGIGAMGYILGKLNEASDMVKKTMHDCCALAGTLKDAMVGSCPIQDREPLPPCPGPMPLQRQNAGIWGEDTLPGGFLSEHERDTYNNNVRIREEWMRAAIQRTSELESDYSALHLWFQNLLVQFAQYVLMNRG